MKWGEGLKAAGLLPIVCFELPVEDREVARVSVVLDGPSILSASRPSATHIPKKSGSYEQATYAIQGTPDMVRQQYGRFLPQDKAAIAAHVLSRVWDSGLPSAVMGASDVALWGQGTMILGGL